MIQFWTDFHFLRPSALLLLPLATGIWWFCRRFSDPLRGWRKQMEPHLLEALKVDAEGGEGSFSRWKLMFSLLTVLAIAGPSWRLEPSPFGDDSTPLLILLKADASMLESTPTPSRMERAQMKIADLAELRSGQPLGLIAYAGSAHLVLPPTKDTRVVAEMASEISPDIMPVAGDRLDLAIEKAMDVLSRSELGGSLVVLTDTVETDVKLLEEVQQRNLYPVQILAVNSLDLSENRTVQNAAAALDCPLIALDVDGADIARIVRRSAGVRGTLAGQQQGKWQEAGYWLVPVAALLALLTFRRVSSEEKT